MTKDLSAEVRAMRCSDALLDADDTLGVAQVAERLGMSEHTIRYYERVGLVSPARDSMGRRRFDSAGLRRLEFLRRMRASGMGMADLERYIALVDEGPSTEPERLALMIAHREAVRERLHDLELALAATEYKIATYGGALDGECTRRDTTKEKQHDHDA